MELFLQVYSKPSQIQPPPFALYVLFIECGVVFSPKENVSPIHKQCNNFITFLWLTGLNCNLDIQTCDQHVTNNESAIYFLVAAHTSTNKHTASGSLPAKSLYPAFHSFIQIISTKKKKKLRVSIMFHRSWKSYHLEVWHLCRDIYHPVTWHLWGRLLQQQSRSSVSTH